MDNLDVEIMEENATETENEELTNWDKPEVSVEVTASECLYHFVLTAKWKGQNVNSGMLTLKLKSAAHFPEIKNIEVDPAGTNEPTYVMPPTVIWSFGPLNQKDQRRTAEFDAPYIGAKDVKIIDSATASYDGGKTIDVTEKGLTTTIKECTDGVACCEACDTIGYDEVQIAPCEDRVISEPTVVVAPRGRTLSVNLDFPRVCKKKDINIGVFVTEVMDDGTEVAFAHKVIRRTATDPASEGCADDRDCSCVDFMIDENEEDATPCTTIRTFRVRTKAHYIDSSEDAVSQQCECDTCTI